MQSIWIYIGPIFAALLSMGTGYFMARLNRAYSETTKQKEVREAKETKVQQQAEANRLAIENLQKDRLLDKLNNDKDFAAIAEILKEAAETTKAMVGIMATIAHLKEGQTRIENDLRAVGVRVDNLNDHIMRVSRNHAQRREDS